MGGWEGEAPEKRVRVVGRGRERVGGEKNPETQWPGIDLQARAYPAEWGPIVQIAPQTGASIPGQAAGEQKPCVAMWGRFALVHIGGFAPPPPPDPPPPEPKITPMSYKMGENFEFFKSVI